LRRTGGLGRFEPVADMPGLPRALATTLHDLRMAGIAPEDTPDDLRPMRIAFDDALRDAKLADHAEVLRLAAEAVEAAAPVTPIGARLVWHDAPIGSAAEARLLRALAARAPTVTATCPAGDAATLEHLGRALGAFPE